MNLKIINLLFFCLLIFFSCNNLKIKNTYETDFQRNLNVFFKDATTSPLIENDLKNFNNSLYIKHTEIPLANEIKNGLDTRNNLLIHNTIKIYNYFFSYNEAYTLYFCSNKNKKNICDFYNRLFKINLKNANINSKYNELKIFENIYNIYKPK